MLRLYNSLSRKKEVFRPLRKGTVLMYTCGPTVHDYAHLGNFRTFVFYDLLRRWLEYRGYKVKQVLNITDVDEKTLERAKRKRVALEEITGKYEKAFFEDLKTLNIEHPEFTPRATENIDEMTRIAKTLLDEGYAFRTENGAVYFDVTKTGDYGRLSGKTPRKNLKAKSLREDYKTPKHFGLWKPEKMCGPGACWETALGRGSPGWHLQCSAMALKYLGPQLDISAGGEDLLFPHHENTIALSEAYSGKECAKYWLHAKHLMVDGGKMSKSLRNYHTLRDILKKGYEPRAIRLFLLSTHYRKEANLTSRALDAAQEKAEKLMDLYNALGEAEAGRRRDGKALEAFKETKGEFEKAMDDDLNMEEALKGLFKFTGKTDPREVDKTSAGKIKQGLLGLDRVMGLVEGF